jgi:hypothetical protein
MADDANALTPKPDERPLTEADYEAIVATLTQSERGRWFLTEFAKRNRNADTRMVLDAVARIETSMARQPASADPAFAAAAAIADARRRASEILSAGKASREIVEQHVKALRELTWTLREWGTDNAICDRLDAHASAIADVPGAFDTKALLAIFDDLQPVAGAPSDAPAALPAAVAIPANVDAAVAALKPETLGAALLTQGLIATPRSGDPLAPLRRMTQAEKVALFT